jgi:hypothetical protein
MVTRWSEQPVNRCKPSWQASTVVEQFTRPRQFEQYATRDSSHPRHTRAFPWIPGLSLNRWLSESKPQACPGPELAWSPLTSIATAERGLI